MEQQIRLADGVHYLDNWYGYWVVRDSDHVRRIVRTRIKNVGAVRAVAESWLWIIRQNEEDILWRRLVDRLAILDHAELVNGRWAVVMFLPPLRTSYVYLISDGGETHTVGSVSPLWGDETAQYQGVRELLAQARRSVLH